MTFGEREVREVREVRKITIGEDITQTVGLAYALIPVK